MDLQAFKANLNLCVPKVYDKVAQGIDNTISPIKPKPIDASYTGALKVYADKDRLAKTLVTMAYNSDIKAIAMIYDRLEPVAKDININTNGATNSVVEAINAFKQLMDKAEKTVIVKEIEATEVDG